MQEWILNAVRDYGYFGVFFLIAVENLFPPIPSELILTFGGFFSIQTGLFLPGMIAAATAGSMAGAVALYYLGSIFGRDRVYRIAERYGKILSLKTSDLDKAYGWFEKWQGKAVFFGRLVPILRSLISIPAGMAGMKLTGFLALTLAGSLLWNTILMGAGAYLGSRWTEILVIMKTYSHITYLVIGLVLLAALVWLFVRRKDKN